MGAGRGHAGTYGSLRAATVNQVFLHEPGLAGCQGISIHHTLILFRCAKNFQGLSIGVTDYSFSVRPTGLPWGARDRLLL